MASLAVAFFILAVLSGYTNQPYAFDLLMVLGLIATSFYIFFSLEAYREDRRKKSKASHHNTENASVTKAELLGMAMKARNKYDHNELEEIYTWLNKKE